MGFSRRHPIPSREEQILLSRRIRAWQELGDAAPERVKRSGIRAMHALVMGNMGIAMQSVRRYEGRGTLREDLIQVATIGLVTAAKKFDPTLGYAFSTYAMWWVRQGLQQETRGSGTIRVPRAKVDLSEKAKGVASRIANELGRMPTLAEIGEELGATAEQIQEAFSAVAGAAVVSLNRHVRNGDGCQLEELLGIDDVEERYEQINAQLRAEQAAQLLHEQEPAIAESVLRVYRDGESPGQLAEEQGIPRGRLRQRMERAMRRVKVSMDEAPIPFTQVRGGRSSGAGTCVERSLPAAA